MRAVCLSYLALATALSPAARLTPVNVNVTVGSARVLLAVAGGGAFRVSVEMDPNAWAPSIQPLPTRMVAPNLISAAATVFHGGAAGADAIGIKASFGSVSVSPSTGILALSNAAGRVLSAVPLLRPSSSLTSGGSCDTAGMPSTDKANGERLAAMVVTRRSDCCGACESGSKGCDAWIFADPPEAGTGNNCWLMRGVTRTKQAANRTLGRVTGPAPGAGGVSLVLGGAAGGRMYGSGGGRSEAGVGGDPYAAAAATPVVGNTVWYVPTAWSTDGYAALGVASANHSAADLAHYPVSWKRQNSSTAGAGAGPEAEAEAEEVVWAFEGTAAELYLMPAPTLKDGVAAIAALTGGMDSVPPRYAFGFLACRWGWSNRSYIESTLQTFRRERFPLDAFISDYGWFTDVPNSPLQDDFGWNNATWPDPAAQLAAYHEATYNVRFGAIRKPRIANASMLAFLEQQPHWLIDGDAQQVVPYEAASAAVAAGVDNNLNMSDPAVRSWYAARQAHYLAEGVDFWWNDEGETEYFTYHAWNEAHGQALAAHDPGKRLFTLNRAFTPGLGRDVASGIWTGDIDVSWDAFKETPGTVLRWAVAGAPFVACDTGGFEGGATPPELLARWYQLSALLPIMRVHSRVQNPPHWPWLYGAAAEAAMRAALELRYLLVPFLYSLAHAAATDGTPMARPLLFDFPGDSTPAVAFATDTYTLGGTLLAAPVMEQGAAARKVTFPRYGLGAAAGGDDVPGGWFEFNSSTLHAGGSELSVPVNLTTIPMFVRQAAVLPLAPAGVQFTDALASAGALDVHVYAGADAVFRLVEDDGETRAYRDGSKRTTTLQWDERSGSLSWRCSGSFGGGGGGGSPGAFASLRPVLFCPGALPRRHAVLALSRNGTVALGKCS